MTSRNNLVMGLALLAVVAAVIIRLLTCPCCWPLGPCPSIAPPTPVPTAKPAATPTPTPIPTTALYVCGGYRYFADPEIQNILHDQYRIEVTGEFRKGTFAMAVDCVPPKKQVDCIFPGSKIGIDDYQEKNPGVIRSSAVAAQDRIILFTWQELLPSLEKAGLVYSKGGSWYVKMKPLVDAMIVEKQWREIGADIPGYVRVESTDPVTSSTGVQWLAFVGSYLVAGNEAGGRILTMADLEADPTILKRLYKYWENQGAQVDTTAKLFSRFIASGAGSPMIVAYESSFTDWYVPLPPEQKEKATRIVGLYPEYTIGVEHILASLTKACDGLLSPITSDPKIQELAWKNHGLHPEGWIPPGPPSSAPWLAMNIPLIPEPKKDVTDAIIEALSQ